eukprot:TRINITY_DN7902_c0_g2_i1.p1 TRINITY_DN7902_c0_g2~~TRINITY_DN7902_c0_g2_i1.p1  ORF type:complete len:359 (+),score=76.90 TRINITY_DN7902_c0_g2_i1:183-1259(+)
MRASSMAGMFASELRYRTARIDDAALRKARGHLLHIDASHGPESVVSHGAEALLAETCKLRPDVQPEHVRLWDSTSRAKMEYNLDHVRSKMASLAGKDTSVDAAAFAAIEELAAQVATARGLVVTVPMWNFGVPWILKQYFDCILHPGLTFREGAAGELPSGLLGGGRPLVIITSAGGSGVRDHLTPWLTDVSAMLGFTEATVISAPNVAHGERQRVLDTIASDAAAASSELVRLMPRGDADASHAADGPGKCATAKAQGVAEAELVTQDWSCEKLIKWLREEQGGVSEDALESLEAGRVDGGLWHVASEDDWRNEELGLEDVDVLRLLELQEIQRCRWDAEIARIAAETAKKAAAAS